MHAGIALANKKQGQISVQNGIGHSRSTCCIATLVLAVQGHMDHRLLLLPHAGEDPEDLGQARRPRSPAAPPRREPPRCLRPRRRGHRVRHGLPQPRHRRPPPAALRPLVEDVRRLFVYWYGSEPRLCVTDAGMVRELLSSKHAHVTGKSWLQRQGAKHFIGRGVLMANGATWYHQRHVVAPAFMANKLKGRVGHMVECTRQTVRTLREAVARGGNEVEIGAHMARLAGDVIASTEFDTSYETGKRIFHLIEELQRLTARSSRYLWVPGSQYFPSKYRRGIKRLNGELEQVLKESIRRSREIDDEGRMPSAAACGRGLLGMLLAEMEKKKKKSGHGELGYDAQMMIDECKTFFFAGHETSALLLTWAIMLLATHPAWQDKARAEVAHVCGDAPPTADHLPKLTILQMVINETLRMYPPATLLPRMAFEDITLGGELRVPRGASVWIPVLAIHHDKAVWGADAHEFRPDRFAPGRARPGAGRFLPFAAGPRNCVGQAYAMVEAKVVLAMLLASFRFGISDEYRHAPVNVLTLRPRHGVPVRLLPLRP